MAVIPKIPEGVKGTKQCACCGRTLPLNQFSTTYSPFFNDGYLSFCDECITNKLETAVKDGEDEWEFVNKICAWAGIPFIVKEWERVKEITLPSETWRTYAKVFAGQEYERLGWIDYHNQYKKLKEVGLIEEEIPLVREERYRQLRHTWGENYDDEALNYLEDLYKGLLTSQNVNGALQIDQARKICKLSYEIDSKIRAGDKDVDKFMASYDKLVKTAEFTPKNTKNATDFDSFAEVGFWLEKHGFINKFYDGATRDVIDETLKNIENYNQKLYINEGGIGEEITSRIEALKRSSELEQESFYGFDAEFDNEAYDNAAISFEKDEDFILEVDDEGGAD